MYMVGAYLNFRSCSILKLPQNEDVHGYTMSLTIDELRWLHLSQTMDLLPTVRSNKYVFGMQC